MSWVADIVFVSPSVIMGLMPMVTTRSWMIERANLILKILLLKGCALPFQAFRASVIPSELGPSNGLDRCDEPG